MKIKKIFLISLMSFGFNSIAYADDFFYVGAGAGKTTVDTGVTVGTASLDEDDSGFKVFAGIPLNQYLAIEYFYNCLWIILYIYNFPSIIHLISIWSYSIIWKYS